MTQPKLAAFTTKHQPMPTVLTKPAAIAGPMTRATFTEMLFSVTALRTRGRPTTSWTNARRAGLSTALRMPNATARTTTCHSRISPARTLTPRTAETRPRPAWVASSRWRLLQRSISSPAYGDSNRIGAYLTEVINPRIVPEWLRRSTSSAWATVSTHVPMRLSACPDT